MGQTDNIKNIAMIRKVTLYGLLINVVLAGIKFIVGFLGSSQAVIADAVHSVSDITTDIAVIIGVRFWSAPPDTDHPYGHQKIEAMVTIGIGLALASVAVGLAYNSLATIHDKHILDIGWVAVMGPALSIIVKEALYRWNIRIGAQAKSSAVIANAWHHRSDALSSIPTLITVVVAALYPGWGFVDHIGAIIISVFILKVAWDINIPAIKELCDTGASIKVQEQIRGLVMQIKGVKSTHAIRTRKFGTGLYVDLRILVEPTISVRAGHEISENVKKQLLRTGHNILADELPEILDVVIHIEPYEI
jgi:cation diffusion facilitator family transporter